MRSRRYPLGLLIMVATAVSLNAQDSGDILVVTPQTTQPPTRLVTADEVIEGGGEGSCIWRVGPYGECSATCAGTQTREVFCQCTLNTTEEVRATSDNCDRDDLRIMPISSRSCGIECPPDIVTTQPPTTRSPPPVCRWRSGNYSVCSATCEGTQTRAVTCVCVLSKNRTTTVSDDVCDSEDPTMRPQATLSCGVDCPLPTSVTEPAKFAGESTTQPPPATTQPATTQTPGTAIAATLPPPVCRWTTGEFSGCSATCGGTQARPVFCQCTRSTGGSLVAGDNICDMEDSTVKPNTSRSCGNECPDCNWMAGKYSECSATCEGTQTRNVTCVCVLPNGGTNTVADDVCDSKDPRPSESSSCGINCPTRTPEPTRVSRECNLTECQSQSDCYNNECCLQVRVSGKENSGGFFCFPLLQLDDICDPGANWTCSCSVGLKCTNTCVAHKPEHKHKKARAPNEDLYEEYRAQVHATKGDCCPTLYKKSKKPKHHAVCVPATDPPKETSYCCDLIRCDDQRDCDEDECCLEVDLKEGHTSTLASFCVPLVDENEACDPKRNWSCPCRDGLNCTQRPRHGPRPPREKDHSQHYRPMVTLKAHEICPKMEMPRKPGPGYPTCKQLSTSPPRKHKPRGLEEHASGRRDPEEQCPGGRRGPGKTGPGHTGPGRTDSEHSGPGHTGPGHTGPGHTGPEHTSPGRNNSEHSGPGHMGPGRTDSEHSRPGHTGPGMTDSEHAGPGRNNSDHTGPGMTGSGHNGPEKIGPGHTGPGKNGPGDHGSKKHG